MTLPHSAGAPLGRVAAVYAVSLPLALALTPDGWSWEAVAAACAVGLGFVAGLAPWWLVINALFLPALAWALMLEVSPLWGLGGLAALILVYGAIWKSRVPLFFSTARAQHALLGLLPHDRPFRLLDAGCGDGRVLGHLASHLPRGRFEGIEQAPVPWLLARVREWACARRYSVQRADLWTRSLAAYDVVYAYLSPAVMERFWEKARREMKPGALLVSAFAVPGAPPERTVEVGDALGTQLHVWRMDARIAS